MPPHAFLRRISPGLDHAPLSGRRLHWIGPGQWSWKGGERGRHPSSDAQALRAVLTTRADTNSKGWPVTLTDSREEVPHVEKARTVHLCGRLWNAFHRCWTCERYPFLERLPLEPNQQPVHRHAW